MKRIAIIGATGAVGREMLRDLESSGIPCDLGLFASARSEGFELEFRSQIHKVEAFSLEALSGYQYVLMSAGGDFSLRYAKALADQGRVVIDNSSAWRMDQDVPLIVPEVNGLKVAGFKKGIIANPNCSTIQMAVSLKPLADHFGLELVQVATYQSVSGSGQKGIDELRRQAEAFPGTGEHLVKNYAMPISANLIPAIDVLTDDGHCREEIKMIKETQKILEGHEFSVFATTVRVPVFNCHCEAICVKLTKEVQREDVMKVFSDMNGLVLYKTSCEYPDLPTPLKVTGDQRVHVARVRLPLGQKRSHWVQFWNVADNLKKGAATNAVQILKSICV